MYEGEEFSYEAPQEQPPEESSNRTFLIAAGVLGGLILLTLVCAAVYMFVLVPQQRRAQQNQQFAAQTQQALVSIGLTGTAQTFALQQTAQATPPPTETPLPSPTPLIATPSETPTPQPDPLTATVAAALTQAAQAQLTVIPTSTALPNTGLADEMGFPGLIAIALVLIAVIFLVRRLRVATR